MSNLPHGVNVTESFLSPPAPETPNISNGAIVGTAPDIKLSTDNISSGGITSIRITAPGDNYTEAPTVTIGAPGGSGTTAEATAVIRNGQVVEIIIDKPGSGYTTAPAITFTNASGDTTGAGAAAEATTPGKFTKDGQIGYNEPFLITRRSDAPASQLGTRGTLPKALDDLYSQIQGAKVVIIPIQEYEDGAAVAAFTRTWEALSGGALPSVTNAQISLLVGSDNNGTLRVGANTGTTPTKAVLTALKPGQVITIGTGGALEITGTPVANSTYVDIPIKQTAAPNPALTGTVTTSVAVQDGDAKTQTAAIGSNSADPKTGVYAILNAESVTGVRPNLICASGLDTGTKDGSSKNALGAALETVASADQLRAMALIDGPNTNHNDAIAFAGDYGSDRTILIDPGVKVAGDDKRAASAFIMGVILRTDGQGQAGWAKNPSNEPITGILGTSRPIDYVAGSAASHAQLLNDVGIMTIINQGGFRTWGAMTPAAGTQKVWKFINVRRIADVLYKAVQDNHLWAVSLGIDAAYFERVTNGVNAFIREMKSKKALINGICYPNPDLNDEAAISNGQVYFEFEYTPRYPAVSVNFNVALNTEPLNQILA